MSKATYLGISHRNILGILPLPSPYFISLQNKMCQVGSATVLTSEECRSIIQNMFGVHRLIVQLIYRSGFRLREAMQLRVKDLDFPRYYSGLNKSLLLSAIINIVSA